jgi:hypothetical protein
VVTVVPMRELTNVSSFCTYWGTAVLTFVRFAVLNRDETARKILVVLSLTNEVRPSELLDGKLIWMVVVVLEG